MDACLHHSAGCAGITCDAEVASMLLCNAVALPLWPEGHVCGPDLDGRHRIPALGDDLLDPRADVGVLLKPYDSIHLWELPRKFISVALGHAPRHDDALGAALLELHGLENLLDRLCLCVLDECACVYDYDVGI